MNTPATSVRIFGIYLAILGPALIAAPNLVLAPFGFPATSEVWIRVVGVVATCLALYYLQAARYDLVPMYRVTILARTLACVCFAGLVISGQARPALIFFGLVDLAGAAWTLFALRGVAAAPAGPASAA